MIACNVRLKFGVGNTIAVYVKLSHGIAILIARTLHLRIQVI